MIHNCWSYFVGNRHELRSIADQLEEFDASMRDVYIDTSGIARKRHRRNDGSRGVLSGRSSVDKSFMTGYLDLPMRNHNRGYSRRHQKRMRLKALDVALSKSGNAAQ